MGTMMALRFLKPILFLFFCLFALSINFAQAEEANAQKKVAQVLVAEGKVIAYTNASNHHELSRGSDLFEDEWLEVSTGGRADVRVLDGSVVSFLENSQYHFISLETDPDHPETYKNIASLTQGGLKIISGQLSKANPAGYTLQTPVTTIGIRGTEFIVTIPEKNTVHAFVQQGSINATSSYAAFVSGDRVSKVSKELVTVLNAGDAIQATPRTVSNIRPENVFGYGGLAPRTLDTGGIGASKSAPSPSGSSQSPHRSTSSPTAAQRAVTNPNEKAVPPGSTPPESGFCHSL
jgi:hypothetical protein